jgi:hypothetical protein
MRRPARSRRPTRLLPLVLAALAALAAGASAEAAPQRWAHVATAAGFSIDQPLGWMSIGTAPDQVDIVSRGCRQPGLIICDGEARITVRSEAIAAKPKALKSKACWSMEEKVSEADEGPRRRSQTSEFSCDIGARRFVIVERHWKGDKRSASYGRIAIRMAKSLRYPG